VEGVRRAAAVSRGVGQWIDDLQLLDGRAGPAVGDDERHRIFMSRADVNEVDAQPIDLGDELGAGVQLRLAPSPVVMVHPIPRERLNDGKLHALICIGFLFRPPCRFNAPAQLDEVCFRNIHMKRHNSGVITARLLCTFSHRLFSVAFNVLLHFLSSERASVLKRTDWGPAPPPNVQPSFLPVLETMARMRSHLNPVDSLHRRILLPLLSI
jgi:hypothetical protein